MIPKIILNSFVNKKPKCKPVGVPNFHQKIPRFIRPPLVATGPPCRPRVDVGTNGRSAPAHACVAAIMLIIIFSDGFNSYAVPRVVFALVATSVCTYGPFVCTHANEHFIIYKLHNNNTRHYTVFRPRLLLPTAVVPSTRNNRFNDSLRPGPPWSRRKWIARRRTTRPCTRVAGGERQRRTGIKSSSPCSVPTAKELVKISSEKN